MASSMTPAVASGLSESRGLGTCPSSTNGLNSARRATMHEHLNSPRKLRRRPVAAALAAAVAASVFLSVPPAQANDALGSAEQCADAGSDARLPPAHEAHPAGLRSSRGLHLQMDACGRQADHGPKQHNRGPGPELHEPERHHAGDPRGLPGHERRRVGLGHVVPDRREGEPDQLQGLGRHLLARC